jgi:hypothetical protein
MLIIVSGGPPTIEPAHASSLWHEVLAGDPPPDTCPDNRSRQSSGRAMVSVERGGS